MAIKLLVLLNKVFYEPTETVVVTVKIENDPPGPGSPAVALIKELVFHASGHERTDPSWISKLWRPELKPESTENRRNVRTIFRTEPATLLSTSELLPGSRRQFNLRFRLPACLPPTYKGSSVRFSYAVEVRAVYELSTGSGAPSTFETLATSSLLLWPPQGGHHRQQQGSGPLPSVPSMDDPSTRAPGFQRRSGSEALHLGPERVSGDGSYSGSMGPSSGPVNAAAAAAAAAAGGGGGAVPEELQELPLLEYRVHQMGVKVRFAEVSLGDDLPKSANGSSLMLSPAQDGGPSSSHLGNSLTPDQTPVKHQRRLLAPEQQHTSISGMPSLAGWVAPAPAGMGSEGGGPGAGKTGSPAALPGGFPAAAWPPAAPLVLAGDGDDDDDGGSLGGSAPGSAATTPRHHHHHHHQPLGDRGLSAGLYASAKNQQQRLQRRESEASSAAGEAPAAAPGQGAFAAAATVGWSAAAAAAARPGGLPSTTRVFGKSFMLSAAGAPVLKLTLQAPLDGHLQPGNTFGGLLDFRFPPASSQGGPAAPRCHQLSIMLETEEVVAAPYSSRPPGGSRAGQGRVMRVLHCEHQEITSHVASSHFLFTIPAGSTPSFRTPLVSLRWLLRFELVVGPPIDYSLDGRGQGAPAVQTLVWPLPLVVLPPQTAQH